MYIKKWVATVCLFSHGIALFSSCWSLFQPKKLRFEISRGMYIYVYIFWNVYIFFGMYIFCLYTFEISPYIHLKSLVECI